jgi:hypothetical protein
MGGWPEWRGVSGTGLRKRGSMSESERETDHDPAGRVEWIDAVCDRYEDEWQAGRRPALEEYLRDASADRLALLRELVRLETEYRRRAGEQPTAAEYEARYPELAGWAQRLLPNPPELASTCDAARVSLPSTIDEPSASESELATALLPTGVRYRLAGKIARGGMGVIYLAEEPDLGRHIAVKVLRDRLRGDPIATRRFLSEARITARLQHPSVPPVFEVGRLTDGSPFMALKLIQGETLADVLAAGRDGPSALWSRLLPVFEHVCLAVGYAHSVGVVHRDLKPENVMVGAFGEVQVMDWGLAKVIDGHPEPVDDSAAGEIGSIGTRDGEANETQDGSVLGTPAYMSPEQAMGAVDQIDRRSDVFGLGAILAAVLTGRPPFAAGTAEATRREAARGLVQDCFARLDACVADPGLVELCKRCLAVEKADRPADAGEVARAVAELRAAAEERARRAELERVKADAERAAAEAREQRSRRRAQLALTGVTGLILLGCGAVAWWLDRQASDRRAAEQQRVFTGRALITVILTRMHLKGEDRQLMDHIQRVSEIEWPADLKGYNYRIIVPYSKDPDIQPSEDDVEAVAGFLADPARVEDARRVKPNSFYYYRAIRAEPVCAGCHADPARVGQKLVAIDLKDGDLMVVVRVGMPLR